MLRCCHRCRLVFIQGVICSQLVEILEPIHWNEPVCRLQLWVAGYPSRHSNDIEKLWDCPGADSGTSLVALCHLWKMNWVICLEAPTRPSINGVYWFFIGGIVSVQSRSRVKAPARRLGVANQSWQWGHLSFATSARAVLRLQTPKNVLLTYRVRDLNVISRDTVLCNYTTRSINGPRRVLPLVKFSI